MIPKTIHLVYWNFTDAFKMPPNKYLHNRAKIQELHPDFQFNYWNKQSCLDLVRTLDSSFFEIYEKCDDNVQYQYIKIFILYSCGGVNIDMDVELYHNLEPLLSEQLADCDLILFAKDDCDNAIQISDSCMCSSLKNPHLGKFLETTKDRLSKGESTINLNILSQNNEALPFGGIDHNNRNFIRQISKEYTKDGVIVLPPKAMLGMNTINKGCLFGTHTPIMSWQMHPTSYRSDYTRDCNCFPVRIC